MIETTGNLTTKSLKQQPIQSQSFTSESDKNCHTSSVLPENDKESNLNNTNTMNTSVVNNKLDDRSTDIISKKIIQYCNSISNCWSSLISNYWFCFTERFQYLKSDTDWSDIQSTITKNSNFSKAGENRTQRIPYHEWSYQGSIKDPT